MKRLFAILTLFVFLLQTFSSAVILARFYANRDYIAKNLCENRDKPQLHCGGKCCLKKKLAKHGEEQAPDQRNHKNGMDEVVLFCDVNNIEVYRNPVFSVPPRYFNFNELGTRSSSIPVFRPPCA